MGVSFLDDSLELVDVSGVRGERLKPEREDMR